MKWLGLIVMGSILLVTPACGDDDDDDDGDGRDAAVEDAGEDGGADGGNGGEDGGGGDGGAATDPVERGRYIVDHLADCVGCHSPLDPATGEPVEAQYLAGVEDFIDVAPEDPASGSVSTRNLTSDPATGIGDWTDDEIKDAFQNGVDRGGRPLSFVMPYWVFHNMSDEDADAVVAYLRTVPAIPHPLPLPQPPFQLAEPAPFLEDDDIPSSTLANTDPDFDSAERGRYLTGMVSVCVDCHTPDPQTPGPTEVDYARVLEGGRAFPAALFGLPSPPLPEVIYSRNLTPDVTGIYGWTPEQVRTALKEGIDDEGLGICPPMPVGPHGAFGGLTDEDALDIGMYLTTIPAVANQIPGDCSVPPPTP